MTAPAVVIAAPASGSGKTTVATGLIGALRRAGHRVAPFKVGPDYIDPGYHGLAAGRPGRNLDPVLVGAHRVAPLYRHGAAGCDIAVVEGVMGLFDGRIDDGVAPVAEGSTAQVAGILGAPVVLVVDARGHSQSLAALLHGFATFDSSVRLGGVILNRVGSERHEQVLRAACDRVGLPVLGSLPRMAALEVPSRHLGLIPAVEHGAAATTAVAAMTDLVAAHVDLAALVRSATCTVSAAAWDPRAEIAATRAKPSRDTASEAVGTKVPPVASVATGGAFDAEAVSAHRRRADRAKPADPRRRGHPLTGDRACGAALSDPVLPESDSGQSVAGGTALSDPGLAESDDGESARTADRPAATGSAHLAAEPTGFGVLDASGRGPVIAIAGGPAFTFGYAEHRELLIAAGARVAVFDPLRDELPMGTAALVLPGGFPEEHAAALAANTPLLDAVRELAARGLPVHAECAGLLYLTRSLDGHTMAGVVPATAEFGPRLTLGYRDAVALADSPLWRAGERVTGHEFHRTHLLDVGSEAPAWGWRGGLGEPVREGALVHRVHASYLHTHPAGNPSATARFVEVAASYARADAAR
ncbi:cobyrinate a,c-diamide synthase [Nocardia bovistercoris]|uniref:Hydrogenobyrinate a,c-diamide synthase n=1 Tax=Nocardia bovistercoris TaxID=2785916 RepID=A0A931N125_9NOCA|nr:cobyrinate a,c-diamide synthase [Nocardia bovistercoris]MBH0775252.1 cobyrinate a,c-diamide synthase [Nocardia bovistercoris]